MSGGALPPRGFFFLTIHNMKHRKSKPMENLGKNRHNLMDWCWTAKPSRLYISGLYIPRIDEPQGRLIYTDDVQTENSV